MKNLPTSRLDQLMAVANLLTAGAEETARVGRKVWKEQTRRKRGATVRPGLATPLWNELIRAIRQQLTRHGDQARLARLLGVHRQAIHRYVGSRTACPDAERTLLLLWWLQTRTAQKSRRGKAGGNGERQPIVDATRFT